MRATGPVGLTLKRLYGRGPRRLVRPRTVREVVADVEQRLAAAGVSEPRESAGYLIAHVFSHKTMASLRSQVSLGSTALTPDQRRHLEGCVDLRLRHLPVQYIVGTWTFCGLEVKTRPPVLIPRPETEELVEHVVRHVRTTFTARERCHVLDVGCGSGAIGLALLHSCPNVHVTAIDPSEAACELTRENASSLGLGRRVSVHCRQVADLAAREQSAVAGPRSVDVCVSNPPYVPSGRLARLQEELKYEDERALDGGPDGLNVIRDILDTCLPLMSPGGYLFLETDSSHPAMIQRELREKYASTWSYVATHRDFGNFERFCVLRPAS